MAANMRLFLIISFMITFLVTIHPSLSNQEGFSTNLIHRDYSPLSPLYNSSHNHYERLRGSIQRSMSKIRRSSGGGLQSKVTHGDGEYLMELSFGTPPVSQVGIVDPASDLIWIQCEPCSQCYKQSLPIFDSRKSSTYMVQSCDTGTCLDLGGAHSCTRDNNTCYFTYEYADSAYTAGYLATETISFKSSETTEGKWFSKMTFGCGQNNGGPFPKGATGIIGLGGGPLSLVSQLGPSIGGKFSYCLIPLFKQGTHTSNINFGDKGDVLGPGVISTPIVKGDPISYYYLTLNGISVGNTKIPFHGKYSTNDNSNGEGNIIIDVGATMTELPQNMYNDLITALDKSIQATKIKDPTEQLLQVCYRTTNGGVDLGIPDITAHFEGGDVVWKPINTFLEVTRGVMCLAIIPAEQLGASIGNIAQMDFLVGFDTVQRKVSFKPMDCTTMA